jgi:hypothetical protein
VQARCVSSSHHADFHGPPKSDLEPSSSDAAPTTANLSVDEAGSL